MKIKYILLSMLPTILFLALFFILKPNNREINQEIKRLKEENKMLAKKNDSIFLEIGKFEKLKVESDKKIAALELIEDNQEAKVKELNVQLKKLKTQYEKANNHSANFSSADIQRYFSDNF